MTRKEPQEGAACCKNNHLAIYLPTILAPVGDEGYAKSGDGDSDPEADLDDDLPDDCVLQPLDLPQLVQGKGSFPPQQNLPILLVMMMMVVVMVVVVVVMVVMVLLLTQYQ